MNREQTIAYIKSWGFSAKFAKQIYDEITQEFEISTDEVFSKIEKTLKKEIEKNEDN